MTSVLSGPIEDEIWCLDSVSDIPMFTLSWMNHPSTVLGTIEQLAPGFFVVRVQRWLSVTVLDRNADLPLAPLIDTPRRPLPFSEWHNRAGCRGMGWDQFFGDDQSGRQPSLHPAVLKQARKVCKACPVARDCLVWALTNPEDYGIWGGTSGRQRKAMKELAEERADSDECRDEPPTVLEELADVWLTKFLG